MFPLACICLLIAARPAAARIEIGDPLPEQTLYDLQGTAHQCGGSGSSVQLLYFLGSGCAICADIAARIETDFVGPYQGEPLSVFAIDSLDGTVEDLGRVQQESGARFPFLRDGSSLVSAAGIAWHSVMIVDEEGLVRYLSEGANPDIYQPEAIREVLDGLLGHAAELRIKTWGEIKQLYERR